MEKIDKIIEEIMKDCETKRTNAAYSGSYGDNGASDLEKQIKFYQYGRKGIIPPEWKQYENKIDPEYQEFLRLKKKFEGE